MNLFHGLFGKNDDINDKYENADNLENKGVNAKVGDKTENNVLSYGEKSWEGTDRNVKFVLYADHVASIISNGKKEIMDEAVWKTCAGKIFYEISDVIEKNKNKYVYIPHTVKVEFLSKGESASKEVTDKENAGVEKATNKNVISRVPRWNLEDMYLPEETRDKIQKSLLISRHKDKLFGEWKLGSGNDTGRAIVFNFFGPPGTGKSMAGEAIASMLQKKVYSVNYAELESKYVGETPKNISAVFKAAREDNAVIIFDEADSFLGKRLTNVQQSADYGVNITRSVMLMELEKYDGVVIFTTNLIKNYDDAFKRRILASIEFNMPDVDGRRKIWEIYFNRGIPTAENISPEILAKKYENISGADIKDIMLYAAVSALSRSENDPCLNLADFDEAVELIRSRNEKNVPKVKVIKESISKEEYDKDMEALNDKPIN